MSNSNKMETYLKLFNLVKDGEELKSLIKADEVLDQQKVNNTKFSTSILKGKKEDLKIEENLIDSVKVINKLLEKYNLKLKFPETVKEILSFLNIMNLEALDYEFNKK